LREASLALFACFVSFISLISFLFCLAKVVNMAGLDRDCSAPAFPTEKEVHFGDWITVGPQSMRRRDDPSSPVRRVVVVSVVGCATADSQPISGIATSMFWSVNYKSGAR
jgi:hypothetical protein